MQWDDYSIIVKSIGNVLESGKGSAPDGMSRCSSLLSLLWLVPYQRRSRQYPPGHWVQWSQQAGRPGLDLWPGGTWPA
jgi:hypothetical protein